jgi:hypothetical protein
MFATRIDKQLLKSLKLLSVYTDRPVNDLLEEAVRLLIERYEATRPKESNVHYSIRRLSEIEFPPEDVDSSSGKKKGSKK